MSPRIHKSTLVEDVIEEIREMILAGDIAPGEYLPPRKELATRFDVGVSTVHEAIQALTAVGLVESRPGKGTWVREDALSTLIHPAAIKSRLGDLDAKMIYDARTVIEVGLTEFAAARATDEDIEHIWAAQNALEAALDDDEAFIAADLEFHLAVAKAAHNDLLEQFYHLARKLFSEIIIRFVAIPGVKRESIPYQRAIAQAIAEHDTEQARAAAINHMEYMNRLLNIS